MDILSLIIGLVAGILAGLIANYTTPAFTQFVNIKLSMIVNMFDPDRFDLTGKWEQSFHEPSENDPKKWVETKEIVQLNHYGNIITGRGETQRLHRVFYYDFKVKHNMVFGLYLKKGEKGNLTGAGMSQLMVTPDRLEMNGQATWFDHETNKIESSEVLWKKIA